MKNYNYVYKIINLNPEDERKYYIGVRSCDCIPEEDTKYMSSSKYLKEVIVKYGLENFKKEILSIWETRELANAEEIRLHQLFDVARNEVYYNLSKHITTGFSNYGVKRNKKFCDAIRNRRLGSKTSDVTKLKLKEIAMNRSPEEIKIITEKIKTTKIKNGTLPSYKNAAAMIKANTGSKHSLERRKKSSEAHKGKQHNMDTRSKISLGNIGKKRTEEAKKKMSEAAFNRELPKDAFNEWDLISPCGMVLKITGHLELDKFCNITNISKSKLMEFKNNTVPQPILRKYRGEKATNTIGWQLLETKKQFKGD